MKKLLKTGFVSLLVAFFLILYVSAVDSPTGTVFLSEDDGGNITFSEDISYYSLTWVNDQIRFTNLTFDTYNWGNIGFRAPNTSRTMNITLINSTHIIIDTTQIDNTTYQVYLPEEYEPNITGAYSSSWISSSMNYHMIVNGTVIIDWVGTPPNPPPPNVTVQALIESYPIANYDSISSITDEHPSDDTAISAIGQAFNTTVECYLTSVKFYLKRTGNPTANLTARLYALTGTFGTSAEPVGVALTSSNPVPSSTLQTSLSLISFNFTDGNEYQLVPNTTYGIAVEATTNDVSGANSVVAGRDGSGPTHNGNGFYYYDGDWIAVAATDYIFYLYGNGESPIITELDTETISRNTFGWVNTTVYDSNGVANLNTVYLEVNTSGDANSFTLRWFQANDTFQEFVDSDNICTLNASVSTSTQLNITTMHIAFYFNMTGGQSGTSTATIFVIDDEGLNDTDSAEFAFSYFNWNEIVYDLIDDAFGQFGIYNFMSQITTYITGVIQYFSDALTNVVSLIDLQFSIITNVFPWVLRWMVRIVNRLVSMGSILVSILNGTHDIMTGIGSLWDLIELTAWVDIIVLVAIFIWIETIGNRGKTQGVFTVFINDIQTAINILGYFMSMFMIVINIVVDNVFRLFSAII